MSFYKYEYNNLPTPAPTGFWYATWTDTSNCVHWSQTKPDKVPDGTTSWVVGVADDTIYPSGCPSGASTLSSAGGKSLPPQPPIKANSMPSFETAFGVWANGVRDADLAE